MERLRAGRAMRIITVTAIVLGLRHCACFTESVRALSHIERSNVVRLQKLSSRSRRSTSNQEPFVEPGSQEKYPEELWYHLYSDGISHRLHLEKNRFLVGLNYTEIYYKQDGSIVNAYPRLEDHCYYHGRIDGMEDSSVSVGVCSGMRGFVRAEQQLYLIEPLSDSTEGDHAFYKQEDLKINAKEPASTVSDSGSRASLFKRSNWSAFRTPRYVEMFLVVDNAEYKSLGSDTDTVQRRMLEVVNHVDKLYRPHNIRVMLVGLEVWSIKDQILVSVSSDDTLSRFINWRRDSLLKRVKHDNAQFVTGIDFLGETVGLANKFAMCAVGSGGINQDHNKDPLGLAATIAHEMGHNMGMSHDAQHCTCGQFNTNCIMTERVGITKFPQLFSDCSLNELSVFLENANPSCLLNLPRSDKLYGGPVCGNAFLDPGEECDCGSVEECKNPCCSATTCRLTEGSQCAEGDCCENCQIKQVGSICRASANECDLSEYCTGLSEKCPEDSFKINGVPCSSGDSYCFNGQCPTHLQHCQRLWGEDAKVASDACFFRNTFGRNDSHCGRTKDSYRSCAKQDMHCGSIFCIGGNKLPITGLKATLVMPKGLCNMVGERSEEDNLSMVPTGTKCGQNKVCFDYKCQDVKVYGVPEDCSSKCNGRGVCDHRQQCHCDPGWAPPYCGTSYADLTSGRNTVIGVSVAVGVLLVLAVAFGSWIYCKKSKKTGSTCKMKTQPGQLNPLFEIPRAKGSFLKDRPQISQPTFIESTATPPSTPLTVRIAPTRPPPQPPKKVEQQSHQLPHSISSLTQMKPVPPTKPLCPGDVKQVNPPLPPVKPVVPAASWRKPQTVGEDEVKIALRPPNMPRR
ncbi:disintegrin and metalloproteinase domain-containing protein 8 [Pygocentrus nattereri]|uniref:ADAM metallopeptidase domain 8b n=1 Tax=Pygocentrus nattereri TaxID=42514 RepID=A0A3B4C007_PYGNA|nr:disintegrin and metalloproteinase domain-containing protein 8 [Pygocentrus nattereri]